MIIDEAIQLLEECKANLYDFMPGKTREAMDLGIEALKDYLESSSYSIGILLPGETRETEEYERR